MREIIEFTFESFSHFCGMVIFFLILVRLIYSIIDRFLKFFTIKKHGYPPSHCNAKGDLNYYQETSK